MLRRWVKSIIDDHLGPRDEVTITNVDYSREVVLGADLGIAAYRINNGYILRIFSDVPHVKYSAPILIYCQNEKEIAEQIIAQAARSKIIPNDPPWSNLVDTVKLNNNLGAHTP